MLLCTTVGQLASSPPQDCCHCRDKRTFDYFGVKLNKVIVPSQCDLYGSLWRICIDCFCLSVCVLYLLTCCCRQYVAKKIWGGTKVRKSFLYLIIRLSGYNLCQNIPRDSLVERPITPSFELVQEQNQEQEQEQVCLPPINSLHLHLSARPSIPGGWLLHKL